MVDSCTTTSLIEHKALEPSYDLIVPSKDPFLVTLEAFTDSVSDLSGDGNKCGVITYEVLDEKNQAAPSFISIIHSESAKTVTL